MRFRRLAALGITGLLGAAGGQAQPPDGSAAAPQRGAHHPGPPSLLTVDDYLNCVRGCGEIFGAVESEAGLECIRGCRWTSSREAVAPEPERQ